MAGRSLGLFGVTRRSPVCPFEINAFEINAFEMNVFDINATLGSACSESERGDRNCFAGVTRKREIRCNACPFPPVSVSAEELQPPLGMLPSRGLVPQIFLSLGGFSAYTRSPQRFGEGKGGRRE